MREKTRINWDSFDSPEVIAEEVFNTLNQEEVVILPAKAKNLLRETADK